MDQLEASGHFDSSERCEIGHARCPGLFRPLSTIYATEWGCTQDLGLLGKNVRSNFFLFNAAGDAFRCGEIPLKMPFLIWTMGEKESGMLFPNEMGNLRAPELFFWGNVGGHCSWQSFAPFFAQTLSVVCQCLHAKTAEAMPLSLLMNWTRVSLRMTWTISSCNVTLAQMGAQTSPKGCSLQMKQGPQLPEKAVRISVNFFWRCSMLNLESFWTLKSLDFKARSA